MSDYISEMRKLVGHRPLMGAAAGVIILDEMNRVLLQLRTDNDMWGLPGGALEPGERLEETARREVQEEVGLQCGMLELFGIYSGPEMHGRYPNGDELFGINVIYLCREFSGEILVDPVEGKEAAFFCIDDFPAVITPFGRPVIADLKRRYREIVKD